MIIIETERLILRHFDVSDAACFFELNKDPEVMKYTGDVAFESVKASADFIKNYDTYAKFGVGRWTVVLKSTNEPIGWCGLKVHPGQYVDLGYRFMKSYWGQGYATEASKASLKIGFESYAFPEIVGRTARQNIGSVRVLEKLGMQFWKNDSCEGIKDSVYYHIQKADFKL